MAVAVPKTMTELLQGLRDGVDFMARKYPEIKRSRRDVLKVQTFIYSEFLKYVINLYKELNQRNVRGDFQRGSTEDAQLLGRAVFLLSSTLEIPVLSQDATLTEAERILREVATALGNKISPSILLNTLQLPFISWAGKVKDVTNKAEIALRGFVNILYSNNQGLTPLTSAKYGNGVHQIVLDKTSVSNYYPRFSALPQLVLNTTGFDAFRLAANNPTTIPATHPLTNLVATLNQALLFDFNKDFDAVLQFKIDAFNKSGLTAKNMDSVNQILHQLKNSTKFTKVGPVTVATEVLPFIGDAMKGLNDTTNTLATTLDSIQHSSFPPTYYLFTHDQFNAFATQLVGLFEGFVEGTTESLELRAVVETYQEFFSAFFNRLATWTQMASASGFDDLVKVFNDAATGVSELNALGARIATMLTTMKFDPNEDGLDKLMKMKTDMDTQYSNLQAAMQKIDVLEKEKTFLENQLTAAKSQNGPEVSVIQQDANLRYEQAKLTVTREYNDKVAEFQKKIADLQAEIGTHKNTADLKKGESEQWQATYLRLQSEYNGLNGKYTNAVKLYEDEIRDLKKKLKDGEKDCDDEKKRIREEVDLEKDRLRKEALLEKSIKDVNVLTTDLKKDKKTEGLRETNDVLRDEVAVLKEQLEEMTKNSPDIDKLKRQWEKAASVKRNGDIAAVKLQLDTKWSAEVKSEEFKVEQLTAANKKLKTRNNHLKKELSDAKKEWEKERKKHKEDCDEEKKKLREEFKKTITDLGGMEELKKQKEVIENLKIELATAKLQVRQDTVATTRENRERREDRALDDALSKNRTLEEDKRVLKAKYDELQKTTKLQIDAEKAKHTTDQTALLEEIGALKAQIEDMKKELSEQEVSVRDNVMQTTSEEITQLKAKITEFEAQVKNKNTEIKGLEASVRKFKREKEELASQVKNLSETERQSVTNAKDLEKTSKIAATALRVELADLKERDIAVGKVIEAAVRDVKNPTESGLLAALIESSEAVLSLPSLDGLSAAEEFKKKLSEIVKSASMNNNVIDDLGEEYPERLHTVEDSEMVYDMDNVGKATVILTKRMTYVGTQVNLFIKLGLLAFAALREFSEMTLKTELEKGSLEDEITKLQEDILELENRLDAALRMGVDVAVRRNAGITIRRGTASDMETESETGGEETEDEGGEDGRRNLREQLAACKHDLRVALTQLTEMRADLKNAKDAQGKAEGERDVARRNAGEWETQYTGLLQTKIKRLLESLKDIMDPEKMDNVGEVFETAVGMMSYSTKLLLQFLNRTNSTKTITELSLGDLLSTAPQRGSGRPVLKRDSAAASRQVAVTKIVRASGDISSVEDPGEGGSGGGRRGGGNGGGGGGGSGMTLRSRSRKWNSTSSAPTQPSAPPMTSDASAPTPEPPNPNTQMPFQFQAQPQSKIVNGVTMVPYKTYMQQKANDSVTVYPPLLTIAQVPIAPPPPVGPSGVTTQVVSNQGRVITPVQPANSALTAATPQQSDTSTAGTVRTDSSTAPESMDI